VYAEQAIGISADEFTRAKGSGLRFLRSVVPLIDLGLDRAWCMEFLAERDTVKSACAGCPFHGDAGWRWVRDNDPDGWAEAVEFDRQDQEAPSADHRRHIEYRSRVPRACGMSTGTTSLPRFASPQIAVAGVVAFTVSEIVDALSYTRLRRRSRLRAVGLVVDSVHGATVLMSAGLRRFPSLVSCALRQCGTRRCRRSLLR
jgi:hypothetical protein